MVPVVEWLGRNVARPLGRKLVRNAPKILTTIGIGGIATTAIMAAKASPKAKEAVEQLEFDDPDDRVERYVKTFKTAAPYFAGTAGMAVLTAACFLSSQSILSSRQAAAAVAASVAEGALKDYQDDILKKFGERKAREVKDDVAAAKLARAKDIDEAIIEETGYGSTICYDSVTGRYFRCDIEQIRRAENLMVKWCADETEVDLNSFYAEIGLRPCNVGRMLCWRIDGTRPDIHFSSHLKGETPVLVLTYNFDIRR